VSFVRGNKSIEVWLKSLELDYSSLNNSEYIALLKKWRFEFEGYLDTREFVSKGSKAMEAIESFLPSDMLIFNFPGYKFLPSSTNARDKVYAYRVKYVIGIDREVANENDCIVCDLDFNATCLYTHEWQGFGSPIYIEK